MKTNMLLTVLVGGLCGLAMAQEEKPMASPLAIGGYCPVSYFESHEAVKGDPTISTVYAGSTYYFAKDEYKKKFEGDVDKYIPQYAGWCTMALGGPYGNKIESDPKVFMVKEGKLYLFSSERAKNAYIAAPTGVMEQAEKRFDNPWLGGYCPVSFREQQQGISGDPNQRVVFRRLVFYCATADAKAKFAANPEKYLPEFGGFDPVHIGDEQFIVGNGKNFTIRNNRVYLFVNEANKKAFDDDPDTVLGKAAAHRIKAAAIFQ